MQVGAPKPRDRADSTLAEWKSRLTQLRRNKEWRSDSEGDKYDPWGTPAIHHCIARVLQGIRYNKENPISISLHQAGFFFHNVSAKFIHNTHSLCIIYVTGYIYYMIAYNHVI